MNEKHNEEEPLFEELECRVCGCTDSMACVGGCYWIEEDLCSKCAKNESEQFSFFRVPKVLFTDPTFKNLSSDAKILYGILLDRMELSNKNGWVDKNNRIYIYFTIESIMEIMNWGKGKAVKTLAELETNNGVGLIEKKRQGLGNPNMIYINYV